MKELIQIREALKVPKSQKNTFGNYKYRSCEDILEAVKPLLANCSLTLSDETKEVCGIPYVEATATLSNGEYSVSVKAQAGVAIAKKGMDISQSWGSSSSYARKYALNGLFLIDDTKDADTQDNRQENTEEISDDDLQALKDQLDKAHAKGHLKQFFHSMTPMAKEKLRNYARELI